VTVNVKLPPLASSQVQLTHTRLDDQHGNAHTLWVAQGSPEAPSPAQLSQLRAAMSPVVLEQRQVEVMQDSLSVSLELPRFGVSLLSFELPEAASPPRAEARGEDGCSCRVGASPSRSRAPLAVRFAPTLALLLLLGWRRGRSGDNPPHSDRRSYCP
jgi:hypothetical protein